MGIYPFFCVLMWFLVWPEKTVKWLKKQANQPVYRVFGCPPRKTDKKKQKKNNKRPKSFFRFKPVNCPYMPLIQFLHIWPAECDKNNFRITSESGFDCAQLIFAKQFMILWLSAKLGFTASCFELSQQVWPCLCQVAHGVQDLLT